MAVHMQNVIIGSETGLLKAVDVNRSIWSNLNSIQSADRSKEILTLCWNDSSQEKISCGLRNREIHTFDIVNNARGSDEKLGVIGGHGVLKALARINDNYITAVESGLVKVWNKNDDLTEFEAGDKLCCMVQKEQNKNIVATGGDENNLKLWDIENTNKPIFIAKNVRNDWLNLRVPVKVHGIQFVPQSEEIVTCTGYHQVRLYDPRTSQRRPVVDMNFDEYPIMSMGLCYTQADQVVVGNTQGKTALLDFRKGKVVHKFKGFAGSVRSIECHPSLPLVVSCGLDRFVRIHHIQSRELLHKFYLKSRLNCLLLSKNWQMDSLDEGIGMMEDEDEENKIDDEDDNSKIEEDNDDVWDKLEVLASKKQKHTHLTIDNNKKEQSEIVIRSSKRITFKRTMESQTKTESNVLKGNKLKKK